MQHAPHNVQGTPSQHVRHAAAVPHATIQRNNTIGVCYGAKNSTTTSFVASVTIDRIVAPTATCACHVAFVRSPRWQPLEASRSPGGDVAAKARRITSDTSPLELDCAWTGPAPPRRRWGRSEPNPGADVAAVRCGSGEPSPGADVATALARASAAVQPQTNWRRCLRLVLHGACRVCVACCTAVLPHGLPCLYEVAVGRVRVRLGREGLRPKMASDLAVNHALTANAEQNMQQWTTQTADSHTTTQHATTQRPHAAYAQPWRQGMVMPHA